MKAKINIIFLVLLWVSINGLYSQAVGINTQNIPDDIILRIFADSKSPKGVLFPSFTSNEIATLVPKSEGLMLYNKTLKTYQMWRGDKWTGMDGGIWQRSQGNSTYVWHDPGYVGIQAQNPETPLHVAGNVNQILTVHRTGPSNGTSQLVFKNSEQGLYMGMGIYGQFGLARTGQPFGSMLWIEKDKPGELKVNDQVGGVVPRGGIIMWSGSVKEIPEGWKLCNGEDNTPDLRSRFVVGYDKRNSEYNKVGNKGGEHHVTLTDKQMPVHSHEVNLRTTSDGEHNHGTSLPRGWGAGNDYGIGTNVYKNHGTYNSKDAGEHSHSVIGRTSQRGSGQAHENRPPYYVIAFIMKK